MAGVATVMVTVHVPQYMMVINVRSVIVIMVIAREKHVSVILDIQVRAPGPYLHTAPTSAPPLLFSSVSSPLPHLVLLSPPLLAPSALTAVPHAPPPATPTMQYTYVTVGVVTVM